MDLPDTCPVPATDAPTQEAEFGLVAGHVLTIVAEGASVEVRVKRFADTYQMLTLSPADNFWPPSSVSLVTLRRKYMTGDAQRFLPSA